jgi:hypothetical protein
MLQCQFILILNSNFLLTETTNIMMCYKIINDFINNSITMIL